MEIIMDETMDKNIQPTDASEENVEVEVDYKEMSPARTVVRRFFRSRLSLVGLVMLLALFAFSFIGPPIMHLCGYQWQETETDYTPTVKRATTILTGITTTDAEGNEYEIVQFVEGVVGVNSRASISKSHFLGTDEKGMDVFIRLMYGGRVSLTLGFVVVILETIIGIIMGGIAGYFGGKADQVIMRVVDILNCIPTLPILLIVSAVIDSWQIPSGMRIYYLMMILTIFGWSGTARMVRGQILYLREQEFIVACEVMGIPTSRRIFKHLVPNIMPQLIVSMTLGLGSIILYESTLSYLGLGIPLPYAAWGTMISSSTDPVTMAYYPALWVPAGILIVIAVLAFNFVGDGLRDAMDPKSKR
jgi:peptide/nickel transport system permease protein